MVILPAGAKIVYVRAGEYYWLETNYGEFELVKCVQADAETIRLRFVYDGEEEAVCTETTIEPGKPSEKWLYPIERPRHAYQESA